MIQANELRIGNWVSFLKEPYKVAIDDIVHLTHVDDPRFEPLQISPEILEKAGFVKYEKVYTWYKLHVQGIDHTIHVRFNGSFAIVYISENGAKFRLPQMVAQLHVFQNLYYSLVGSELPLNL